MKFDLRKTFVLIMTVIMVVTSVVVPAGAADDSFEVREYSRYEIENGKYISGAKPGYVVSEIFADFTREDTFNVYSGEILKNADEIKAEQNLEKEILDIRNKYGDNSLKRAVCINNKAKPSSPGFYKK